MVTMRKELIDVKVHPRLAELPFSQGIRVGPFLFISGQAPRDPKSGEIDHGTIQEETALTFENIKRILEAAGTSLENLVKLTIFLKDINDYAGMNEVRKKYVGKVPPVSSAFQVANLNGGIKVEIEAIALIPEK
jgi:2-iminobutanoate/2-iminopropanoate deaminase